MAWCMKKGSDLVRRDLSPLPCPACSISHFLSREASCFEADSRQAAAGREGLREGRAKGGKLKHWVKLMQAWSTSLDGRFPRHQRQCLIPRHPAFRREYLPGLGGCKCKGIVVLGFPLSLGGGKALYNLLKQECCSPNALWLTEMNPKTSFN